MAAPVATTARHQARPSEAKQCLKRFLPEVCWQALPPDLQCQCTQLPEWGLDWRVSDSEVQGRPSGRIGDQTRRWRQLTGDPEVTQYVQGFCLEFSREPVQWRKPLPRQMSSELTAVVTKEVQALQEKGALEEVPPGSPGFLSPLFVVPKKNGKMRPVADLRELNQFVQYSRPSLIRHLLLRRFLLD